MRWVALGLVMMGLAGCGGAVAKAEDAHRIALASVANDSERCAIERKLADAYLAASDEEKYKEQKLNADMACLNARLNQ